MVYLKNLKIKLRKYVYLLIISIIISLSLNSIFFSKERQKHVYEIAILKDYELIETKEGIFFRLLNNLEKVYAYNNSKKYKECQGKYDNEPYSLTKQNLVLSCIDNNILFIELATKINYVVINLKDYDEVFDRHLKLSMNETVKEIKTEIDDLIVLVDEFLPIIKENGNFEEYIRFQKLKTLYETKTEKTFDIMISGKGEKLSYIIIDNLIIIFINIIIYFFFTLFFAIKKK